VKQPTLSTRPPRVARPSAEYLEICGSFVNALKLASEPKLTARF